MESKEWGESMENENEVKDDQQANQNVEEAQPAEQAPAEEAPMQPMPEEGEKPAQEEEQPEPAADQQEQAADQPEQAQAEEQLEQEAAAENQQAAQEENPQEEEEEKAEAEAEQPEQPKEGENPQNPGQGGELAGDDINQEIASVAAQAGIENDEEEEGGDPDRAFDTLDDLKKLNSEQDNAEDENDPDTSTRAIQDRKMVRQLRKGNLYKAVIYGRMLENGENPAEQAQAIEQKGASQSRFNRFLNSSKLDTAGKALKTVNAASSLIGMADSKYKNSKFNGLIGKANDIMILINSVRNIIKKLRTFRQVNTSPTKKAFAVVSLVSDFGMAISKGASLAQGLASRAGLGGLSKLLGKISSFANIVGQVAGLTSVCKGLTDLAIRHRAIKKAQKAEEAKVLEIFAKYKTEGNAEGAQQENAEQENAEQENAAQESEKEEDQLKQESAGKKKEDKKKEKKQKAAKAPKKRRRLIKKKVPKEKVLNLLERPDVSAEDKAVLSTYLMRGRMISKSRLALANVSTGLITATLALGTSVSKAVMTNKHTSNDDKERAGKSTAYLGAATNVSMLLSTLGMHVAGKAVNSTANERAAGLIKEGIWGNLHELGSDDKFGLRKISATLEPKNPDKGHLQEAEYAARRYETASKQFEGAGINYAKLFAANDLETFKNSLVAGL